MEAKNVVAPTPEWLAHYLRNLFTHGVIPQSNYALLALRDHLYLWRRPDPDVQRPPDFEGETAAILAPYLCLSPNRLEARNDFISSSNLKPKRICHFSRSSFDSPLIGGSLGSER